MFINTGFKEILCKHRGRNFMLSHNGGPDTDQSLLLDKIYEVTALGCHSFAQNPPRVPHFNQCNSSYDGLWNFANVAPSYFSILSFWTLTYSLWPAALASRLVFKLGRHFLSWEFAASIPLARMLFHALSEVFLDSLVKVGSSIP